MRDVILDIPLHKHTSPHKELVRRYKNHFSDRNFRFAVGASLLLFLASLFASGYASVFATAHASNSVSDIVLSNTPVANVGELFVYGTLLFALFTGVIIFAHPRRIPFTLLALTLFFFIRSGFVLLTHIGPFPEEATADFGITIQKYFFGDDLFFSGHTGAPFLMALIFWREWRLRYAFLAWSIFFACVVLLGHLHYSIDVASAYFITYTVFCLAEWLFPEYRVLFYPDVRPE